MAIDERGDEEADDEATRDVDDEGRPWKVRHGVALDQGVEAVARQRPDGTTEENAQDNGHESSLPSVGAISRWRRLMASPIAPSVPSLVALPSSGAFRPDP